MGNLSLPRPPPQFGEPQALPPQVEADVAAAFLGMPLSADYIWRGFLGRHPPTPAPAPAPTRAGGRAPLPGSRPLSRAGEEPPRLGRRRLPSAANPGPAQPPPRAGHRAWGGERGRGGRGGRGRGFVAAADRGGRVQPRRLRALGRKGFSTPPAHHLDLVWGGVGSFSGSPPPPPRGEGFEAGLQSRRRLQGPRAPPAPRTPPGSPGRRSPGGPPAPPKEAAAVSLPLLAAWHPPPRRGRGRGRWVPRPPGSGGAGRLPGGAGGDGSGEVAAGAAPGSPGTRR